MKTYKPYIVVGVLPDHAEDVLGAAAVFARRFEATLACATVNPSRRTVAYTPDGTALSLPLISSREIPREELPSASLLQEVDRVLAGTAVDWEAHALAGDPSRELELLADRLGADMIVVGTRGPGAREVLRELFNGSVADHLVYRQQRPVVVVPLKSSAN